MKVAFISDIHSNIEALSAVMEDIKSQRIEKIICCGDIVGYNANPNECCFTIKSLGIKTVMGNHDFAGSSLKDLNKFNDYAKASLEWTNKVLKKEYKEFLLKLPKTYKEKIGEFDLFVVHGSPSDPLYEYVFPQTSDYDLKNFLEKTKSDIIVVGHTHIPFVKRYGRKLFINCGSVGQPRDSDPRACYCIIDFETLRVELRKVKYDIDSAAKKVITSGLPRYLAERLYLGR